MTVLDRNLIVPTGMNFAAHNTRKDKDTGNTIVEGLKIFKAGSFADSMGFRRTWEKEHLAQMIFHHNLLKENGIFQHVPWREDHSFSMAKVIGYLENPRVEDIFLLGDLRITEEWALAKWESGTYRARSLEVGAYETNDEAFYWPTIMGVAFVDIGAVEGLHSQNKSPKDKAFASFSLTMQDEGETSVSGENKDNQGGTPPADPNAGGQGGGTTPPADPNAGGNGGGTTPPADPNAGGGAGGTTPPADPNAQHGRQVPGAHAFRVNGATTQDYSAVQAHIDTLEGFRKETGEAHRKDFVSSLASQNKIMATQVDSLTEVALGLTDEAFAKFKESYGAAPGAPLFSNHGQQGGGSPTPNAQDDEREVLEARVKMHRQAGMSQENIEKTESFKKLQALQAAS